MIREIFFFRLVKKNSSNKKLCLQQRGDLNETETRARAEREREQERIKSIPLKRYCIKKKRNVRKPATQRNRTWPCHECFLSHSTKLSMIKWEFQLRERHIAWCDSLFAMLSANYDKVVPVKNWRALTGREARRDIGWEFLFPAACLDFFCRIFVHSEQQQGILVNKKEANNLEPLALY